MATVTLESLDLAALLCSRVCHDVISPVGAIVNGLEVLEDESDASMKDFALDLIRKSAKQASARLQFARLAFGAAGSAGASIDLGDAEQVARGMFQDDKVTFSWSAPRLLFPKNRVKLLLNLLVIATNAVPRGGTIDVSVTLPGFDTENEYGTTWFAAVTDTVVDDFTTAIFGSCAIGMFSELCTGAVCAESAVTVLDRLPPASISACVTVRLHV